ncbi:MAG: BatD family protein [Bacteroidota bacterium]
MNKLLTLSLLFGAFLLTAQKNPTFKVEVSTDSILMDNYFEVKFTLENAGSRQFTPPSFDDFQVLSGPNTSSSMSIVNGEVTQSISYSYYLKPKDIGNYYISPASVEADGAIIESEPVEVMVHPNPDGIIQTPARRERKMFDPFDNDFFKDFELRMPMPPPSPEQEEEKKENAKKKKRVVKKV